MKIKCKNCGGQMSFSIKRQQVVCEHCGSELYIEPQSHLTYHDTGESIKDFKVCIGYCKTCNMDIITPSVEYDSTCPYCGDYLTKKEDTIKNIDGIIPFQIDESQAEEQLVKKLKNRAYAPRNLKKMRIDSSLKKLYISTYNFHAKSFSRYSGYTERTDSEGHTTRHNFSGSIRLFHDNFIEASSKISNNSGVVESFSSGTAKDFDIKYLAGFGAEREDIELATAISKEKRMIDSEVRSSIRNKHGSCTITYCSTTIEEIKYARLLEPIYFVKYKYRKKDYLNYMNGFNGELYGKKPKSVIKILITIFVPLILILALVLIFAK